MKKSKTVNSNKKNNFSYLVIKRVFDIFGSLVGLFFLIPFIIAIKVVYMISGDFGSIFYTQTRIGKNGKEFKLFKFRSMVVNADEELEKILKENKELAKEYNKNKKLENDIVKTKPGLSGYWQVSLRSRGTFKQRLEMEQYYSNNCSLWFDIKIFFKTFIVVFDGKGAQ